MCYIVPQTYSGIYVAAVESNGEAVMLQTLHLTLIKHKLDHLQAL